MGKMNFMQIKAYTEYLAKLLGIENKDAFELLDMRLISMTGAPYLDLEKVENFMRMMGQEEGESLQAFVTRKWGQAVCDEFYNYMVGKHFKIKSDGKMV